ncbi:MAG: methionyl-tRNA formyltransferase, partial [Gammaproteobacteria bacterium]
MRAVFFGSGGFGIAALRTLAAAHDVRRVFCPPPRPAGRKLRLSPCPVAVAAREMSLPLCELETSEIQESGVPKIPETLEKTLLKCRPDVVVVCDYGKLLSPEILRSAPRGAVNIHPSLLPRWRGAAPIPRTRLAGDEKTGVTIMQTDSRLDTGAILLR